MILQLIGTAWILHHRLELRVLYATVSNVVAKRVVEEHTVLGYDSNL